jgi:hypothetical protein
MMRGDSCSVNFRIRGLARLRNYRVARPRRIAEADRIKIRKRASLPLSLTLFSGLFRKLSARH